MSIPSLGTASSPSAPVVVDDHSPRHAIPGQAPVHRHRVPAGACPASTCAAGPGPAAQGDDQAAGQRVQGGAGEGHGRGQGGAGKGHAEAKAAQQRRTRKQASRPGPGAQGPGVATRKQWQPGARGAAPVEGASSGTGGSGRSAIISLPNPAQAPAAWAGRVGGLWRWPPLTRWPCVRAELVIHGTVLAVRQSQPTTEALAVAAIEITAVGSRADIEPLLIGSDTEVIDIGEGCVLPGLIEAHGHPLMEAIALSRPAPSISGR